MIGIAARCPCCIAPMLQGEQSIWVIDGHDAPKFWQPLSPQKRIFSVADLESTKSHEPPPSAGRGKKALHFFSSKTQENRRAWDRSELPVPRRAILKVKHVLSGVETTSIVPPCARAISDAM